MFCSPLVEMKIQLPYFISDSWANDNHLLFLQEDNTLATWKKEKSVGLYGSNSTLIKITWGEFSGESGSQKAGGMIRSSASFFGVRGSYSGKGIAY
jgi:hypothetical protein